MSYDPYAVISSEVTSFTSAIVWAVRRAEAHELTADEVMALWYRLGRGSAPTIVSHLAKMGLLRKKVLRDTVGHAWCGSDRPEDVLGSRRWMSLFRRAGYAIDGELATRPPEPLRLYRGATERTAHRMAWTADVKVAERFASDRWQFGSAGRVFTALVNPVRLLCLINDRDESEYVINPAGLHIEQCDQLAS